jgi:hypothetical protein
MTLDYFRTLISIPFPRSLSTALRAFRHGQIGIEAAIYRAGSVDSVHRRPLNIPLIQELLAKSGLEIEINRPVAEELFESLEHPDREIADFAAQTLSQLEERYYRELRRLEGARPKDELNQRPLRQWLAQLSQRYIEFAALQRFNRTLERYYLQKCVDLLSGDDTLPESLRLRRIEAMVQRGDIDAAAAAIADLSAAVNPEAVRQRLIIEGEIAYRRRDLPRVRAIMESLRERDPEETAGPWRVWTEPHR